MARLHVWPRVWSWLRLRLLVVGLLAVVGCAIVDERQGSWIFSPSETPWRGYNANAVNFADHWIPVGTNGEKLHAWFAPASDPQAPLLLYLHGARWDLTGSVTRIPRWNRMGFAVLAIDWRGFGRSSPLAPTEKTANEDAEAAWQYLRATWPNRRVILFGHSLGAAMASQLALQHPEADGLILEAPFTNIQDMLRESKFAILPISGLITQRFDNLARIDQIRVPLLIAHGTADAIVPVAMGERLHAAATARKRLFIVEGGTHHNLTANWFDTYARAVHEHFHLPVPADAVARS